MHIDVPTQATDRRAAYQIGFQDDGLLLAFTVPTAKVDPFVKGLGPDVELEKREKPVPHFVPPMTPFSHLGLKEPEELPDVREGQVCTPCRGDLNALEIAIHRLDDRSSRVYLRGID
ncbi:hypothetical protein [Streptomyces cucumeris]|uniref:hypothetical protein n=1 Tax=Streptomyces cucumeris TaxID=2962890 RepID=UPI003D715569